MKKIILPALICLSIFACTTPNNNSNSTNPSTNTSATPNPNDSTTTPLLETGKPIKFSTKQDFMNFLNCMNTKSNLDASSKTTVQNLISGMSSVTESDWAKNERGAAEAAASLFKAALSVGCAK
ncbi:MAG: hypothetical protein U0354_13225 [Candidatus Sericytochromatia bacterium]